MNKIKKLKYGIKWKLISKYYKILIKTKSKVLDFGAGDLYVSKLIESTCDSKVTGCDIIDYGTNFVKKVIVKGPKLPFKNAAFDYATVTEVLHHIEYEYQEATLKEIKRVAKKIIILEDAPNFLTRMIDRFHNSGSMPVPLAFRKKNEWIKFLSKIGKVRYIEIKRPLLYPLKYYLIVIE
ncbi:MAG TPA: class I SAM-dependent methyltransferase [Candidatus Nanoarchaeia archaeon]|nr:class I SAM-dependent methyltransferase [Candidatus Nanoarchaeia archaeon]